jgi:hypothetical protein
MFHSTVSQFTGHDVDRSRIDEEGAWVELLIAQLIT